MPGTTSDQGLPYAAATDSPDGPAQEQALALAVETKLVRIYVDSADRDIRETTPNAGAICWLNTPGAYFFHDGSGWYQSSRNRIVPNQAARMAMTARLAGDIVIEGDTGRQFVWDGAKWRGCWAGKSFFSAVVLVSGIVTTESGLARLSVSDPGCPYAIDYTSTVYLNKSVPSDTFFCNIRNGTGLAPPSLAGPILNQIWIGPGIEGVPLQSTASTGEVIGAPYNLQMNAVRTAGSGSGSVAAGAGSIRGTMYPTWS